MLDVKEMECDGFQLYRYLPSVPPKCALFFAHANAIPAKTYQTFLELLSTELQAVIYTYDMRGIGLTKKHPPENFSGENRPWKILIADHIALFKAIREREKETVQNLKWILAGHSLGSWISLLSSERLGLNNLILLDPPILPPQTSLQWIFVCAQRKRYLSPMSKKARKRKRYYEDKAAIFTSLSRSSLMKEWSQKSLSNYIESSYAENEQKKFVLRHDPAWEAALFEGMPASASLGFLRLSRTARRKITPHFLVGEKSDTCYPKASPLVKFFFPKMSWTLIKDGKHMFPISHPELTVSLIKERLKQG